MTRFNVGIFSFLIFAAEVTTSGGVAMAGDTGETATSLPSLVVSATRQEMPQSQVSSDITVITKEDISHLPVHDLGEGLNYLPGLVLDKNGGPGTMVFPSIQGSEPQHIKFIIDDIPLNTLSEGFTDLSLMPIENVERVEVLKGSASSAWGSSLGGVINIITSNPSDEPTGEAGLSIGEENTRRYHGIISGKVSGTGYYVSASRFETDGFFKNQDAEINNIYGKLTRNLGNGLKGEFSYGHNNAERGVAEFTDYGFFEDNESRDSFGRIKLEYDYWKDAEASLSLYDRVFYFKRKDTLIGDASPFDTLVDKENVYGGVLKGGWKHADGVLSAGAEASRGSLDINTEAKNYYVDKTAFYLNETYRIRNWDLNAGARFDDDSVFGSEVSPSAGAVYNIQKASTLLRVNVARGFTPPPLLFRYWGVTPNKNLHAERAWTYQAGIETRYIPGLWGKIAFYRADIKDAVDAVDDNNDGNVDYFKNIREFLRQGVEVEARTNEYKGLSLSYGYTFNDVRNQDTHQTVKNKARITHDIGVDYRGPLETMTTVRGHYVWWNADKDDLFFAKAKDKNFIWDAKVSKYLAKWKGVMGEMFVSVHNIFSEKQYLMYVYPNPGTWWEGGVSLTFY